MHIKYGGVIIEEDANQFIAGSTSPISLEPRNTTGNWHQFLSLPEKQTQVWGETFGCVSFVAVHHLAAVFLNWAISNKLLAQNILDFLNGRNSLNVHYIDPDGKVNLSERFIVVLSGTTEQGNSARNVLQAIRNYGLVPESICPNLGPSSRAEYFTITQEARNLGLEFMVLFKWAWQSIPVNLMDKYIVQAPIMQFTAVCPGWDSDNPIMNCNQPIIHATASYAIESNGIKDTIDQYMPFEKRLAADYSIPFAYQLIGYPIISGIDRHIFNQDINSLSKIPGERSQEVMFLQERLNILRSGIYDEATRSAVYNFQLKNKVASLWEILFVRGRRVGSKTRAVLNN